jgi:XTP/dITP diphosphohydrolase
MEGEIISRPEDARGSGGFGYDPIFYIPDLKKTVAELSAEQKNAISHRGKSSRILKQLVENVLLSEK